MTQMEILINDYRLINESLKREIEKSTDRLFKSILLK